VVDLEAEEELLTVQLQYRLAKKRVDPTSAVDHFFGQPLDGPGKTTSMGLRSEFVAPYLDRELVISSSWVFHPQNFGGALDGYSAHAIENSGPRT